MFPLFVKAGFHLAGTKGFVEHGLPEIHLLKGRRARAYRQGGKRGGPVDRAARMRLAELF
jgi:hypothetical protein